MSARTERLRAALQRWNDSHGMDDAVLMEMLSDDFQQRSLAEGRNGMEFTAKRNGKQELQQYLTGMRADWTMNYYRVVEFVEQGDRVVHIGEGSWTHRRTGKTVVTPLMGLWKFRGDKVTEMFEFYDTHAAIEATQPGG